MSDAEIVKLFFERDEHGIEEIDRVYGNNLRNLARRILSNDEDVEEVVNDTYLALWKAIPPNNPVYLYAYIAKICRHLCFGRLDYENAKKRNAIVISLTSEMEQCIPDKYREHDVDRCEISTFIGKSIRTLKKDEQRMFVLRYFEGWDIDELALEFGCSKMNVSTKLHRVRKKLRRYFEKEGVMP